MLHACVCVCMCVRCRAFKQKKATPESWRACVKGESHFCWEPVSGNYRTEEPRLDRNARNAKTRIRRFAAGVGTPPTILTVKLLHRQTTAVQQLRLNMGSNKKAKPRPTAKALARSSRHMGAGPAEGRGSPGCCPLKRLDPFRPLVKPASPEHEACCAAANDCFRRRVSGSDV